MNETIKLAIEKGGYKGVERKRWSSLRRSKNKRLVSDNFWDYIARSVGVDTVLDPTFWQALARAKGFKTDRTETMIDFLGLAYPWSEAKAHYWLDAHFQGKEAEDKFWEDLINKKQ